jgi:hypothetical protein
VLILLFVLVILLSFFPYFCFLSDPCIGKLTGRGISDYVSGGEMLFFQPRGLLCKFTTVQGLRLVYSSEPYQAAAKAPTQRGVPTYLMCFRREYRLTAGGAKISFRGIDICFGRKYISFPFLFVARAVV